MIRKAASLASMLLVFMLAVSLPFVKADQMTISVYPTSITVENVGDTFTLNITISNAANVYGLQFEVTWNGSILNCTSITVPPGHFMDPNGVEQAEGNLWIIVRKIYSDRAEYAVTYYSLDDADSRGTTPRGGSGVIATLKMKALALGTTAIRFNLENTIFGDRDAKPLPYIAIDGNVNVIPEFNTALMTLALFTAATVSVITKKKLDK